ncbi:MAG: hypothetical protein KC583_16640 [Myxococcales bacterium]|nr:hypothetical protein [Myxococcales bacterium]
MVRVWCAVLALGMVACEDKQPPGSDASYAPVVCPSGTEAQCIRFDGLGPIPRLPEGTRCPGGWVAQCATVACSGDDDCDAGELCNRTSDDEFGHCEIAAIRLIRIRPAPEGQR